MTGMLLNSRGTIMKAVSQPVLDAIVRAGHGKREGENVKLTKEWDFRYAAATSQNPVALGLDMIRQVPVSFPE